jgi:fumarate reductase subunit D
MAKSNEPFWWALFGAGGMIAALFMPITIFITGIGVAAGWVTEDHLRSLLGNILVRVYLLIIIALPLFHWAHRFRFTLVDLGLKSIRGVVAILCYGTAIVGTVIALFLVLGLWP